jgi:hypothetical protein
LPKYNKEKKEWETKETTYELSEDGKKLKKCSEDEGESEELTRTTTFEPMRLVDTD